jgi:NADH-quinone oxidoreductase subunit J
MLTPLHVLFYIFAAIAVGSAIGVITARNPVRSVLSLVVTFVAMAAIWMMLRAEFLSLILILVYVGAVMTLFLFVVMMLNIDKESHSSGFVHYVLVGAIVVLLLTGLMIAALGINSISGVMQLPLPPAEAADYSNLQAVGALIFTDYVYPFEIAGVLLLVAIIAAITLAHNPPKNRKVQIARDQINVKPSERVRLVNMPVEKPAKPSIDGGN